MTNFEITNSTHYSVLSVQLNHQQRTEFYAGTTQRKVKIKGRHKINEVGLEHHYPSLLARGTTFHPLKLLSVSGAV